MNVDKLADAVANRLDDYLDSYVVIGFMPGGGPAVIVVKSPDPKTTIALNHILGGVVMNGGIQETPRTGPPDPE